MIPNQWYPLIEKTALKAKPLAIRRMNMDLVLWRDASGRAVCMLDRCPHRGVKLSLGRVEGGQLLCHYHGFKFKDDGACTEMPSEGPKVRIPKKFCAQTFDVEEGHGIIWMWWGEVMTKKPPLPFFEDLPDEMNGAWAWKSQEWPQNYVRSVESNFDISHAPYVHKGVMPGLGSIVHMKRAEIVGDQVFTEMRLHHEGEDPEKGFHFDVRYKAPSLTAISLGKNIVGVVADSPIDDENTYRITRFHQGFLRLPLLDWLGSWFILQLDWSLTQNLQDKAVVETMMPKLPIEGAHRLVGADAGIGKFRALRRKLINRQADRVEFMPQYVQDAFDKVKEWGSVSSRTYARPVESDELKAHRVA